MRWLLVCFLVLGQSVSLTAAEPLKWGADQEGGAPFIFPREDNPREISGFEVELAEVLGKQLKRTMQFVQCPWDNLLLQLDRGDIDLVLNGYEYSPERASQNLASIPYYKFEVGLCVHKKSPAVKSWDELAKPGANGRQWTVGVLGGSAADRYVSERFSKTCDIRRYKGTTEAFRLVETGQLDATVQDWPPVLWYVKLHPQFPQLDVVDVPVPLGYYVVYLRKTDAALKRQIDDAIKEIHNSGQLRRICENYGLWSDVQAGLPGEWEAWPPEHRLDPNRKWNALSMQWPLLLEAALTTIKLAVLSMPLAILAGLLLALIRTWHTPAMGGTNRLGLGPLRWLNVLASVYVEIVRGTPLAFQLFVVYFVLPYFHLKVDAFWAGVIALAVNYSAYEAEIMRLGLQAIPRGQIEAALALGMSRVLAVRRILLPQAVRLVIPATANDFIALFKDTAVCSVIAVTELTKQYEIGAKSTGFYLEIAAMASLLYLAMSYPLSLMASWLEHRLKRS